MWRPSRHPGEVPLQTVAKQVRSAGAGLAQREGELWSCPRRSGGYRGRPVASPPLSCVTLHKLQDLSEPALPAVTEVPPCEAGQALRSGEEEMWVSFAHLKPLPTLSSRLVAWGLSTRMGSESLGCSPSSARTPMYDLACHFHSEPPWAGGPGMVQGSPTC